MSANGNIPNYLRKLQTELRFIKFHEVNYQSLQSGNPCEFLKIYHYIFVDFNPLFAKTLLDKCKSDFYGKTDSHFIDTMYKTLRDYLNYKPPITKDQFFSVNFAERKLQMAFDIILLVRKECKSLKTNQNQPKRFLINHNKEKKQISSNVFHSLHDMCLETTAEDEVVRMEQAVHSQDQRKTINHIEEQIELLKVRIEDINERLTNVTSVLQETHLGNNAITSSDLINFNAHLIMIENELVLLKNKSSEDTVSNYQFEPKQSMISQGILIDSDNDLFNHSIGCDI